MKCPHCTLGVKIEFEEYHIARIPNRPDMGLRIACGECPECGHLSVMLQEGKIKASAEYLSLENPKEELLYPRHSARVVEPEVPDEYKQEFLEACAVLSLSPKASAALSRRLLQKVLREKLHIKHDNLAKEITAFTQLKDVPSYLADAIDAIRNVGNFAAHPLKDSHTGEIVDVEPGEAEWLLEVIESLFDFTFVQPLRLTARKQKLNEKLKAIGKPPMK